MIRRHEVAAFISILLAIGIVIAALLGPLVFSVIRFRMTEPLENQYLGGEMVSLFIVAPALVVAGLLWMRGDRIASALAFGPSLYAVYTFVTAILGQDYTRYPGNAEKAVPLYVAIIAGGFVLVFLAGRELAESDAPMPPAGLRRLVASLFLIIVIFFALAWSGQILRIYQGDAPSGYADSPTLFWLIRMLDLGFLLPAFAATGVGLLKQRSLAVRMSYGLVSFAVCMISALLGMSIAMFLRDNPGASVGMMAFLLPVVAGLAILAARMVRFYRSGQGVTATPPTKGMRHAS